MNNDDLVRRVTDELFWDPKVDNAEIGVSADDGVVTLRGTVGSFSQKRQAEKAAERVYGVRTVVNELSVRILTGDHLADAELRGRVVQALMLNGLVPATIDAKVDDGIVTLTGTANWQYQREEAESTAANVLGVVSVIDDVVLKVMPKAGDVKDSITKALERNASIDAKALSVSAFDSTVKIDGTVRSWPEHDAVINAAWSAPGVMSVDDHLVVSY
jgi:osmotically-inducible protein OsmY